MLCACSTGVEIKLTEDDYRAEEADQVMEVTLERGFRIGTPVVMRVIPLVCASSASSLCNSDDPAEGMCMNRQKNMSLIPHRL